MNFGTALTTVADLEAWVRGAAEVWVHGPADEEFGVPVCQLVCRWVEDVETFIGPELVCGQAQGAFVLRFGQDLLPLPVRTGDPLIRRRDDALLLEDDLELMVYGTVLVGAGVWLVSPSLNIPGVLHAFVVLTAVPSPPPWEQLIVLASADVRPRAGAAGNDA